MKVVDVMASGQINERASVLQSKTQKPVRFEISEGTRASVAKWMEDPMMVGSEYLWPGRFHERLHISTRQYTRIVQDWVSSIGLLEDHAQWARVHLLMQRVDAEAEAMREQSQPTALVEVHQIVP
jgi:hypothetical protein